MAPTDQTVLTAAPAPDPALSGLAAALRGIVGRDHVFEGTEAAILAGAAWGRLGCPRPGRQVLRRLALDFRGGPACR